jgi:TolB-like protein
MAQLWQRLKDHRIAQWTVGYIAVAYGIQHGVVLTTESLDWPHSVERVTMIAFVLGLPLAVVFAWYHGQRTTMRISRGELSIVSLLLVAIATLFYMFVRPAGENTGTAVQSNIAAQSPSAPTSLKGISLAVLPFANVSGDASQEFFSDEMTDEIMLALAKIPSLRVVGRQSAFQFKGKNQDNRAVGKALGATYLIEGSVGKRGDRVRIIAQLVQSDNGVSLWTESYDRDLNDIFAVQEDVARAIASALRVPLGLAQGEQLVSSRTSDVKSYEQYLLARALLRARSVDEATALLKTLTTQNPNYAPIWALLAQAYNTSLAFDGTLTRMPPDEARRSAQAVIDLSEKAAEKAISLDPQYAYGYARLGNVQTHKAGQVAAEDLYLKALKLDPNDPDTIDLYSRFLAGMGRLKEALQMRVQLQKLEPFVPVFNDVTANILQADGQIDAAIRLLQTSPPGAREFIDLAEAYAAKGLFHEAADELRAANQNVISQRSIDDAANLLDKAPSKVADPNALPELEGQLGFVYLYVGAPERSLEYAERLAEIAPTASLFNYWAPKYAKLRETKRFRDMVGKAGLVDYWRERGWPDLCRPIIDTDDFACN